MEIIKELIATIFITWLAFCVADMEKSRKIPCKKKIIFYRMLGCIFFVLQVYGMFK